MQESCGNICCTQINLNKALGQALGEQIDRLKEAEETAAHKYAGDGGDAALRGGPARWAKKQNVQNAFLFLAARAKSGISIWDKSTAGDIPRDSGGPRGGKEASAGFSGEQRVKINVEKIRETNRRRGVNGSLGSS